MHSLFLSDQGHVFSFGCNDDGSLGRPTEKEEDNFTPGIVHFDTEVKVCIIEEALPVRHSPVIEFAELRNLLVALAATNS